MNHRLRVLVISHMYPNDVNPQLGIFVHNQCKALRDAGVELEVLSSIPSLPFYPKWKYYPSIRQHKEMDGIPVTYVPTRMFPGGFFFSQYDSFYKKALYPVIEALRERFAFDLIHCHTIFPDGKAMADLKEKWNVPVVTTVHGSDIMLYPKQNKRVYQKTAQALRKSDQVITVSQRLETEAKEMVPETKVKTVYNGYNEKNFFHFDQKEARSKLELPIDQKSLLFVGNLYPVKGLNYLIEAFQKLSVLDQEIHLHMVGAGKLREQLESQVKDLGLEERVSFHGRRPYQEIPTWIQSADAVVLSSLSEGLPSILLESMACGVPMVATDVGGIGEVLLDQKTGLLVPSQDSEALAQALIKLFVTNPQMIQQLGHAAQEESLQYTWSTNASTMVDIYKETLETN